MVKFHCTAHDPNNSMSCIPTELYKGGGGRGIHLTRDSRSVSPASDAFVWFDLNQMYVNVHWNAAQSLPDHAMTMRLPNLPTSIICLCAVCCTGRHELRFLSCRKKDQQTVHNYGAERFAPSCNH